MQFGFARSEVDLWFDGPPADASVLECFERPPEKLEAVVNAIRAYAEYGIEV